jgi:hypothetical protein
VLRATYLLLVVGLGLTIVPELVFHDPTARGTITGMLSGFWLLAFFGLRYPLQMLPLLMWELVWKTIWMLDFGLPQYFSGQAPPTWPGDFKAIAPGVVAMALVIPWGHVWRHYVRKPADRASAENGVTRVRLVVIRVAYILLFIPGTFIVSRMLFDHEPTARGVFASMVCALCPLSLLVIRYPLQMLPLILLECVWKLIWLVFFGLPQWMAGLALPGSLLSRDLIFVGGGPILFGLLIPWGYVWRHYVKAPGDRWR